MALQEVRTDIVYIKPAEFTDGLFKATGEKSNTLQGFYLGATTNKTFKEQLDQHFQLLNGRSVVVNESKQLRGQLAKIPVGCYVELTYIGKITLTTGAYAGKPCHDFKLKFDPERVIDGATPAPVAEESAPTPVLQRPIPAVMTPTPPPPVQQEAPVHNSAPAAPTNPRRPF